MTSGAEQIAGALSSVYFPYLRGLAHQLNNHLTGILGYAQLLLATPPGDSEAEELREIEGSAIGCRELVSLLSRCVRPEMGRVSYPSQQLFEDLRTLVEPLARRLRLEPRFQRVDPLPELNGNPWRLRGALLALLGHAVERAGEGGSVLLAARPDPPGAIFTLAWTGETPEQARAAARELSAPDPARAAALPLGIRVLESLGAILDIEPAPPGTRLIIRLL